MSTEWLSTQAPATQPVVDWFRPSLKSRWRRVRIVVATLMAGLVLILLVTTPAWNTRAVALMVVWLGLAAALDYAIRRQIKVDQSPVILTGQGLESQNFDGSQKAYPWRNIAGVRIVPVGNGNALHLDLVPSASSTAGSWLSRRSQPFIPLATYSATDQDRIVEAVRHHLSQTHSGATVIAELTQERELIAPLIAAAPRPWVTYALMLVSVLLWLLMVSQWGGVWHASDEALLGWGAMATSEVQRGEWWRVVSAAFVHTGLVPLTITMLGLWSVGSTAERIYGYRPYLLSNHPPAKPGAFKM